MKEGEVIESHMLSRQIERAQRKVEAHNFDARKNLLEYDDVANDQRKVIYQQRTELMAADDVADAVAGIRFEVVTGLVARYVPPHSMQDQWDAASLTKVIERDFGVILDIQGWIKTESKITDDEVGKRVHEAVDTVYNAKEQQYGVAIMRHLEKTIMVQQIDSHWREHLAAMDYLRQGIHLRSYAQKNPKQEYKREAFELFNSLLDRVKYDAVSMLARVHVRSEAEIQAEEEDRQRRLEQAMRLQHATPESLVAPATALPSGPDAQVAPFVREVRKVGRNEVCPCGSGKKFKHCHGALASEG
jgi:preprotein translocase subunit SecA